MLQTSEITLGALLPPPVDDPGLSEQQILALDRVLLIARPGCSALSQGAESRTWLWNPVLPRRIEVLPLFGPDLPAPAQMAGDSFCCGVTGMHDGDLLTGGGVDYAQKCSMTGCGVDPGGDPEKNKAVGHRYAYRLDISVDPPRWLGPADGWPVLMKTEHYYPTLLTRETGRPVVLGHTGAPDPDCPKPYSSWPPPPPGGLEYEAPIDQMREEFDPTTSSFTRYLNQRIETGTCSSNSLDPLIGLQSYPRAHVTGSGWLVHTNLGKVVTGQGFVPCAWFMKLDPLCPDTNYRWRPQDGAPAALDRDGGSSVHLVHTNMQVEREDVIYAIGGSAGSDFDELSDPSLHSPSVQKLIIPNAVGFEPPTASWIDAPALPLGRVNHNTVILPTGELVVMNGFQSDGSFATDVLKYRPPEIFSGEGQSWETLAASNWTRSYHSSALLLRDGRVIVVGGLRPSNAWFTLDIFAPEYYFSTIRPEITSWPKPTQETITYAPLNGLTFDVDAFVHFCPPVTPKVKRVVLMRPGTVTHAFDSSQRFVELQFVSQDMQSSNHKALAVTKPTSTEAPPGFYMLFIVDDRDRPSVGQWVRVGSS